MRFALPTLLILVVGLAGADEKRPTFSGPPPQFAIAEFRGGNYVLTIQQTKAVTMYVEVPVQRGTEIVKEKVPVTSMQTVLETRQYPAKLTKVYDVEGKVVADATTRLEKATPVLLAASGDVPDATYRSLLKKDTLILVSEGPKPVTPTPVPVPTPPK